jgi:hypothetical protein
MLIPDTQVKTGHSIDHLRWAGEYAAKKRPNRIIHIGDHWDMPSLSSYDKGLKCFEGRTYRKDIDAGRKGMDAFMEPIIDEQLRLAQEEGIEWNPDLHFALGNHEQRIHKAVEADRKLEGLIGFHDLGLEEYGWHVHPFLEVFRLDGIAYSHYFTSGVLGRPVTSARALVTKKHMSCVMGHVQKAEVDFQYDAAGKRLTGIFAGCFYQHDEDYLGPQGNKGTWRGIWMFYNINQGEFTLNNVPLSFLRERFGPPW